MEKYPKSYNFDSTVNLVLKVSDRESQVIANEVIDNQVQIPNIEFLQVGIKNTIYMDILIRAGIGLINNDGIYKYYSDEIWLRKCPITIKENLEASFDQNFLNDVEIVVDVQ